MKLWAFGHTHFNCDFEDERTAKRVLANQKGYARAEALGFDREKVVTVETGSAMVSEDLEGVQEQQRDVPSESAVSYRKTALG